MTALGRGPFLSIQRRAGADNRTGAGMGSIQLVAPMLTHWLGPEEDVDTEGIGILNLAFVPEPEKALMLVAGISLLGLLYRSRR